MNIINSQALTFSLISNIVYIGHKANVLTMKETNNLFYYVYKDYGRTL